MLTSFNMGAFRNAITCKRDNRIKINEICVVFVVDSIFVCTEVITIAFRYSVTGKQS